ncbi:MAG: hypothetical protein IJX78_06420 [Bacilli bacterium]|nr:hypothetical protein [Bacilli bacterium]
MSRQYDEYILEHKMNVYKAYQWLNKNLPDLFDDETTAACEYHCQFGHDESKYKPEEYDAYDKYFYGNNKSYEVVQNFNKAWLHHIHNNPHHWQYWVLINDDPNEGEIILDMPDVYIIEMICDWWSFSWKKGDLREIFKWYDERKEYIKLSEETHKKVNDILYKIHKKLNESDVNEEN